ncbi:phospholipase D-like domain-containing protein [Pirellulaceae bacterium SH467]
MSIRQIVAILLLFGMVPTVLIESGVGLVQCRGGELRALTSEKEALELRLQLIQSAEQSIDLVSFQFRDDRTGGQVLVHLIDAASRGVCVRVMVDGHWGSNSLPKPLMDYLIRCGIQFRERPVDVRYQLELGRPRLHDKLLHIDQKHLIIGGRNIEQDYFGIGERIYIDEDFYAHGVCHASIADYIQRRWNECVTAQPRLYGEEAKRMLKKQVHTEWNNMPREQAFCEIENWLAECREQPLAACDTSRCGTDEYPSLPIECEQVQFLHDVVGGKKNAPCAITSKIHQVLERSKCSIDLCTPYCVITPQLKRILIAARDRGVQVRILTNSLESTDQVVAHAAFANERRWLLRHGVQVYEFQGCSTLHAKLILVDGKTSVIGSHNLDYLSERRNSEVALLVNDDPFGDVIREIYQSLLRQSNALKLGELLRYEAKEKSVDRDDLRSFRRLRFAAPFIQKYL